MGPIHSTVYREGLEKRVHTRKIVDRLHGGVKRAVNSEDRKIQMA